MRAISNITLKGWGPALGMALLMNAFLIFWMPALSRDLGSSGKNDSLKPVLIRLQQPPPPPPPKQDRPKPKPREMIKKLPVFPVQRVKRQTTRPKESLKLPDFQFELNPKLAADLQVSAPPNELPSLPREFQIGEVDEQPQILRQVKPRYPFSARRRGITGKVLVKFIVDSQGRVQKPVIVEEQPAGLFGESVLQALAQWRFRPGFVQGAPVSTWVVLPIEFGLSG